MFLQVNLMKIELGKKLKKIYFGMDRKYRPELGIKPEITSLRLFMRKLADLEFEISS